MIIPNSLRHWFLAHFIVDIIFAIPLFFAPVWFLGLFSIEITNPILARLVAAALVGIGSSSLIVYKGKAELFKPLLDLKIIWASAAILGLLWGIGEGVPWKLWLIVFPFVIFLIAWIYYRKKYY